MNDQFNGFNFSSWTFERPFRFESSGTLEEVVRSLAALEEGGGFFSSGRNEMSILPLNDGYSFRYRIRKRNKGRYYTTAYGEGQIWEESDGRVIVEGTSQIDPWSLYGSVGLLALMSLFIGFGMRGFFWFPLILVGIGAFMIFTYYNDRNRVVENISQAVDSTLSVTDQFRHAKDKRVPTSEKVKNTPLSVEEAVRPDSVWNEAISEYDDDEVEHGMR
jgi:hypothetical protein